MLTKDEFEAAWSRVGDYGTTRHAMLVEGLIKWLQPQIVLEIGAAYGCITTRAARALQENGTGYLVVVDNFSLGPTPNDLLANVASTGTLDVVEVLAGDSATVPLPEHIDMALIDGDHGRERCWTDVMRSVEAGARCIGLHDVWMRLPCDAGPGESLTRLNAMGWSTMAVNFDFGYGVALRP